MKKILLYLGGMLLYGVIDDLVDWLREKLRIFLYGHRAALEAPDDNDPVELEAAGQQRQLTSGA